MAEVVWSASSRRDLRSIFDYISVDSTRYAVEMMNRNFARTEILGMQSEKGRMVPELQNPAIRELIEGNYRIVYQIVDLELIRIIAVTHGAQHFQNKFNL